MEQNNQVNDEITLKDLILKTKEFFFEVRSKWYWIVLAILICVSVQLYRFSTSDINFLSEVRFAVEGQQSGGGGLSSILGSFGIKKGGNVNPYKILKVGESTEIFKKVVSEKVENGDMIANLIIETYALDQRWEEHNPDLKDFRFSSTLIGRDWSLSESKAIKKIQRLVWGGAEYDESPLVILSLDEDTGIYEIKVNTTSEDLSLAMSTEFYKHIKEFFEEEVFLNQKQLVDILSAKADSLKLLRDVKVRQLARFKDRNRGMISFERLTEETIITQDQFAISSALVEIIKNKEMTEVNLKDIQPLFMAIDYPFKPLTVIAMSLIFSIIYGILFGAFLAAFLIIILKIYNDIME